MKPLFDWMTQQQPVRNAPVRKAIEPAGGAEGIESRIESAFAAASSTTGTSFDYLVKTAQRESAMNPTAKAKTSSATGLFQFIESTWLETMKTSGAELGLGDLADKISVDSKGRYSVADPKDRAEILALRNDPEVASMMAGALTRRNAGYLADAVGRDPSAGELYVAHFLGARGAASLIKQAEANPDARAADLFPRQAAANKSIFYDKGRARSVSEVYAQLVSTHGGSDPIQTGSTVATAYADDDGGAPAVPDPFSRVVAGFQATSSQDAFSALFHGGDGAPVRPTAAAAFWRGYTMAPALFDVALAEDARALAGERRQAEDRAAEIAAATDAAAAARPSIVPAKVSGASATARDGVPLDLAKYLKL